jgi:hypothetical protein
MNFQEALNDLFAKWSEQDMGFVKKYKSYKSRHLNNSGRMKKKVSKDKLSQMLIEAGYKEDWIK